MAVKKNIEQLEPRNGSNYSMLFWVENIDMLTKFNFVPSSSKIRNNPVLANLIAYELMRNLKEKLIDYTYNYTTINKNTFSFAVEIKTIEFNSKLRYLITLRIDTYGLVCGNYIHDVKLCSSLVMPCDPKITPASSNIANITIDSANKKGAFNFRLTCIDDDKVINNDDLCEPREIGLHNLDRSGFVPLLLENGYKVHFTCSGVPTYLTKGDNNEISISMSEAISSKLVFYNDILKTLEENNKGR